MGWRTIRVARVRRFGSQPSGGCGEPYVRRHREVDATCCGPEAACGRVPRRAERLPIRAVTAVHAVLGGACVVLFLLAGAWGAWRWYRGEPSAAYWRLLRAAQVLLVAEIALGGVMLLAGDRPEDDLHYLYGLLPLLVAFVAEQLRLGSADAVLDARGLESAQAMRALGEDEQRGVVVAIMLREMGVTAVGALVCASLAVRAELA